MDQWRLVVLGDGDAGTTALACQFTLSCFADDPTIEDCYRKQLMVDDRMCFVEVIDTAGQVEYATLRDQWVREGQAFLLVYSIASRSTFDRLEVFRQTVQRINGGDSIIILVGNKCDLPASKREVSEEEGGALARQWACEFIETSAKTGHNVERAFTTLIRALRASRPPVSPTKPRPPNSKRSCVIM
ncbi:ras protein [Mycena albidolilacea]|uniref:Ras protein n=1 Tax=Mycena albidolilacea TaxID=1033008 RepID=A0AAD7F2L1_9AGAR|nr:ras protein [Mycena albidolilacea]